MTAVQASAGPLGRAGSPSPRRIIAWSPRGAPEERLDLLVHALAQLPDAATLEVGAPDHALAALDTLSRAYAIRDRVTLGTARPRPSSDAVVAPAPPVNGSMAEFLDELSEPGDAPSATRTDDAVLEGQRVGIVTNFPTHYRIPLLNGVHRRLAEVGAALRVFLASPHTPARAWPDAHQIEFDHELLPSRRLPLAEADAPRLSGRLRSFRPTLLLSAGFSPLVSGRVAGFASRNEIPFGVWSGDIPSQWTARSRWRRRVRRGILARSDFAIAYGHLAAAHLHDLAPGIPLVYGRNTAPVSPAGERAAGATTEVLAVAQAIPRKGLDVVVDAFAQLRDLPCALTVIGDGPELARLRARAAGLGNVTFVGPLPPREVADARGHSDAFVFPSRTEVFGLALVEAMGSGLATVTAPAPGAVADLAVAGRNCQVARSHEPGEWAREVRSLVVDGEARARVGAAAAQTVRARWTIAHAVDATVAGLRLGLLARSDRREPRG